jgi:hypothetical protein
MVELECLQKNKRAPKQSIGEWEIEKSINNPWRAIVRAVNPRRDGN